MKKKLNLICLLLFLTLFASLSLNVIGGIESFKEAMGTVKNEAAGESVNKESIGDSQKNGSENLVTEYFSLKLIPVNPGTYPDAIYNEISHSVLPAQHSEIVVKIEQEKNITRLIFTLILCIAQLVVIAIAFICLLKLIKNINNSIIFEWVNVKQLKNIGFSLIISFLIYTLLNFINYTIITKSIMIPDYRIDWTSGIQTTNLILGLASLLVAEIFAQGLKLKEEQELTI
ncbi:MAG: DUF2975 domain-containing protein [Bacteroidales bacterium]|nr:DUF2975 domain-containing protein [Bacteroidales bacterium]